MLVVGFVGYCTSVRSCCIFILFDVLGLLYSACSFVFFFFLLFFFFFFLFFFFSFFFFQAEDGIRDTSVTGVQTCALPIWAAALRSV